MKTVVLSHIWSDDSISLEEPSYVGALLATCSAEPNRGGCRNFGRRGGGANFVIKWAWGSKRGWVQEGGMPPPAEAFNLCI